MTSIYTYVKHHYNQDKSTFPSSKNIPLSPSAINHMPYHQLQVTTVLLSVTVSRIPYKWDHIGCTLVSTFSHLVFFTLIHMSVVCSFLLQNSTVHYMDIHFLMHSSFTKHTCCFLFETIRNKTAKNSHKFFFCKQMFSWACYVRRGKYMFNFQKPSQTCPEWCTFFHSHH